ncbi:hypothetical protein ACPF7Z_16925 [Halomonas sp. GXIMD04776]|uniref:hypothetical protein n=1 Tax=Halomonas sp. GXIMD04776 TaxID=3415605 RepID=UPI003CBAB6A0
MNELLALIALGGVLLGVALSWIGHRLFRAWPRRPRHLIRLGVRRRMDGKEAAVNKDVSVDESR